MTDTSTEGQPTGVIEEEASPHLSYTTQVGLGSKRHDPSLVHVPLSNGIQFMGIYTEYGQHISPWQQNNVGRGYFVHGAILVFVAEIIICKEIGTS